jgi:hypothetical protein
MLNVRATRPARRVNWVEESYAWRPETSSGGDEPLLAPRVLRGLRPQRMELRGRLAGASKGLISTTGSWDWLSGRLVNLDPLGVRVEVVRRSGTAGIPTGS